MPKREITEKTNDKRYIRRDARGRFTSDQTDVGRSSAADQRRQSTTPAQRGQGDRGDRRSKTA